MRSSNDFVYHITWERRWWRRWQAATMATNDKITHIKWNTTCSRSHQFRIVRAREQRNTNRELYHSYARSLCVSGHNETRISTKIEYPMWSTVKHTERGCSSTAAPQHQQRQSPVNKTEWNWISLSSEHLAHSRTHTHTFTNAFDRRRRRWRRLVANAIEANGARGIKNEKWIDSMKIWIRWRLNRALCIHICSMCMWCIYV